MLHRIQISTNTCEVRTQVKWAIGKATLHKLPIYNEYMCLCWVSTLFCMVCCLFSNCSKSSTTRLRSLIYNVVNVPCSQVPVFLAMQWSVASRSAFYRGREHLWIVFSLKKWRFFRGKKGVAIKSIQDSENLFSYKILCLDQKSSSLLLEICIWRCIKNKETRVQLACWFHMF